ncbi:hypothetical protein C8Q80DRAFT_1356207 [Daedaleopsis nitida]|nr:hypothetical protein C8Q80DRAFT_1356207 [Daedaleopsis nitida]
MSSLSTPSMGFPTHIDLRFWFPDGNIVLIAQDVEFRVYIGPLIRYSTVFRGRGVKPSPIAAQPRYSTEHSDFNTLSSIIRMGDKYQVDDVLTFAINYLKEHYPDNVDWIKHRLGAPCFSPLETVGVVNLARLTDTPSILPAAFLHCCAADPEALMRGFVRDGGVTERLSADDLARVLIARAELVKADAITCLYTLHTRAAQDCSDPGHCDAVVKGMLNELIDEDTTSRTFGADWRWSWEDCLRTIDAVLCAGCMEEIRERKDAQTKEMWRRLLKVLSI